MNARYASLIAITILLAGCGKKNDANEANFTKTISQKLDASPLVCIKYRPGAPPMTFPAFYPADTWKSEIADDNARIERVDHLVEAGMLTKSAGHGLVLNVPGFVFRPTSDAQKIGTRLPYDQNSPFAVDKGDVYAFCYGKVSLNKVIDWTPPDLNTHESAVRYTYKLTLNEPWASDKTLSARFPEIADAQRAAASNEVVRVMLIQTTDGWRYEFD